MNGKHSIRTIAGAAALLLAAGCAGIQNPDICQPRDSLKLTALSTGMTKGYVEGTVMEDTPYDKLHAAGVTKAPRTINLTAWHYTQTGGEEEYFRDAYFIKNANGETDGLWHRAGRVYWPIGGTLDFLAYSSTIPFPEPSVQWGYGRSTDHLALTVDKRYTQDDIMFSCALSRRRTDTETTVPMVFDHSQAWLQFRLHAKDAEYEDVVTITDITIEDIYTAGEFNVTHPFGVAEGAWEFKFTDRKDTSMDDNNGVYGTLMKVERKYLDMLIPEQKMKDFIITYKLKGSDIKLKYRYDIPDMTWLMGKKYIYDIAFGPRAIEITPTVAEWTEEEERIDIPETT